MTARMRFGPDDEKAFHARKHELETGFDEWVRKLHLQIDASDFGLLLDWKWGYGDGHLGRWHTSDLTEFLLGWCPRKLMVSEADLVASVPGAASLGMSYLASLDLLDPASDAVDTLVEHGMGLAKEFEAAMADSSSFGLGKSLMSAMGVDDLESLDQEGLQRVMDEFNALPIEERRAITDPAIAAQVGDLPEVPSFGPVRLRPEVELREAAANGPTLTTFGALADYLAAPGKPLTQKGNIKIADARALAELLGTGDVYEDHIGEHTFRKRSSTEFVGLDFWQWWARETGAIRVRNNRMVGVKAWQQRAHKDPLAEVTRAFEVLLDYGVLGAYSVMGLEVDDFLDAATPALLGRLLQSGDGEDFEELLAAVTELGQASGVEPLFGGDFRWSLDKLLKSLERVGVVTQEGVRYVERRSTIRDRFDGVVGLTPVGQHLAVHAVRRAGYEVSVLPPAGSMEVADLVDLLGNVGPGAWWDEVFGWLSAAADPDAAFARLAAGLTEDDSALLTMCLGNLPDDGVERVVPLARAVAFSDDAGLRQAGTAALSWLDTKGRLEPGSCGADRLRTAHLDSWIAVANTEDVASTIESIREGAAIEDQVSLVQSVAARRSSAAARLLETIGQDHPDPAVAKAARKELFRLRSRGL